MKKEKKALSLKAQRVAAAYEKARKLPIAFASKNPFVTQENPELHCFSDKNDVVLTEFLFEHTFSTGLTAHVESQLACLFEDSRKPLTPRIPVLSIKDVVSGNEELANFNDVLANYPDHDEMATSAQCIERTATLIKAQLAEREKEIAAGKTPTIPDQKTMVREIFCNDLYKALEYYLKNKAATKDN